MNTLSFILLQAGTSTNFLSVLVVGLIITALFLGVFLLIRSIMLWYWKVDTIVDSLALQTAVLQKQLQLLDKQNTLLEEIKNQTANSPTDPNAIR